MDVEHIGSYMSSDGDFVGHFFEVISRGKQHYQPYQSDVSSVL